MSRAAIFVAAFVWTVPAYAETAYFASIPDLPVATGLSESENPLASFAAGDHAELVIAYAHGSASAESVERFYGQSLSALGWSYEPAPREGAMAFVRGRERLILNIEPRGTGTYLRVRLIVRPASMNAD